MAKSRRASPAEWAVPAPADLERAFREDRRLRILLILFGAPGYTANPAVLLALLPELGHIVSEDRVRTDLAWLAEQGLLEITSDESLMVARLRERGADVAEGRAVVPGVSRPHPGD